MVPLLVAAASTAAKTSAGQFVKNAIGKAFGSLFSAFDPGKARDRDRENRAQLWYDLATQGSITAARHLLGGTTMVYTIKEKEYYAIRWGKFQAANPALAAAAIRAGKLGIPDNISATEEAQINAEIGGQALTVASPTTTQPLTLPSGTAPRPATGDTRTPLQGGTPPQPQGSSGLVLLVGTFVLFLVFIVVMVRRHV